MRHCVFCDEPLAEGPPEAPDPGHRLAYDLERGRLWEVCARCSRWNPVPLELRWEALEACEEAALTRGKVRLESENLLLVTVGRGELIRVGAAPRPEFADWRYGLRLAGLATGGRRAGFFTRLLGSLPHPPAGGYDPYGLRGMAGMGSDAEHGPWLASPFLAQAEPLTYAFTAVPLAPRCPSCQGPLALEPWEFQNVGFEASWADEAGEGGVALKARCALCAQEVLVNPAEARPALRLGMAVVTGEEGVRKAAARGARMVDEVGGAVPFLRRLAEEHLALGDLDLPRRMALRIALDEEAEREALEAEWKRAEEIAAAMEGDLSEREDFRDFRRRVLARSGKA